MITNKGTVQIPNSLESSSTELETVRIQMRYHFRSVKSRPFRAFLLLPNLFPQFRLPSFEPSNKHMTSVRMRAWSASGLERRLERVRIVI